MAIQQMTFGGGVADPEKINIYIPAKFGADTENLATGSYPGGNLRGASVATYWSAATKNYYSPSPSVTNEFKESDFTRVGDGILKFKLINGNYKIYAKSGDGSGNYHGEGRTMEGQLTLSATETDLLLLIPNHGCGAYAGGGGFYLIAATSGAYTSTNNVPILVIGGGGGGYSGNNNWVSPGSLSTSLTQSRQGPSLGTGGTYDGGASFLNTYTPEKYGGVNATRAKHFTSGGRGGYGQCDYPGGFGGGGGGCPGGGGGLPGGYPGTEGHSGGGYTGSQGGGGGKSYYNSSYITSITSQGGGAMNNTTYYGENAAKNGYFGIYGPT